MPSEEEARHQRPELVCTCLPHPCGWSSPKSCAARRRGPGPCNVWRQTHLGLGCCLLQIPPSGDRMMCEMPLSAYLAQAEDRKVGQREQGSSVLSD